MRYNQNYQLTGMFYVLNGLAFNSLYQYDNQGHIQYERMILPALPALPALAAQADANYCYNEQGQLVGFTSIALYSQDKQTTDDADKEIDESFTQAEINQRGDWTKLISGDSTDVMTRTITYL